MNRKPKKRLEDMFGGYAKFYNLLYKDKNYEEESEYVDHLIRLYYPGAKTILDLGCGTGRHDLHLAEKGYLVTGVDMSDEMLSFAKKLKVSGRSNNHSLNFFPGDVREIRLEKSFDVVISLFHVMSYQTTNEDIQKSFKTASTHLKENGIFIFDCWYGPGVLADKPQVRVKKTDDKEISIIRISEPVIYPHDNLVDVHYHLLIRDKKNQRTDEIKECHRMRYLFQPEVKLFLENSDFEFVALLEFLKDTLPGPQSWSACFIARKRG